MYAQNEILRKNIYLILASQTYMEVTYLLPQISMTITRFTENWCKCGGFAICTADQRYLFQKQEITRIHWGM